LVGPSTTSPGYFKYEITIQEESGKIHVEPAYGVDMQDAISRLVWTERVEKVNPKANIVIIICAWLTTLIVPSIIAVNTNDPVWILVAFALAVVLGFLMIQLDNYFKRGR
jgi:type IV secretory pathway TrbL component